MSQLKITYIRSTIHCPEAHKRIVRALGLRKLHHTVVQPDNASIRGMVNKVRHLLRVEESNG